MLRKQIEYSRVTKLLMVTLPVTTIADHSTLLLKLVVKSVHKNMVNFGLNKILSVTIRGLGRN